MFSRKTNLYLIVILSCMITLCLYKTTYNQTFPWSWVPSAPYPAFTPFPFSSWPQPGYFPTTGISYTSGWPPYSPPPGYTPAAGGVPTSSTSCPVGLVSGIPLDEEFGPGTTQITRCNIMRQNIKVVMHIDQLESEPGRPYGTGHIANMIDDYEVTHGTRDYKIVGIVNGSGSIHVLNRNANPPHPLAASNVYQELTESLIAKGVQFYICQVASRRRGIKASHLIPGVKFVPQALTAIVDFQRLDYKYLHP